MSPAIKKNMVFFRFNDELREVYKEQKSFLKQLIDVEATDKGLSLKLRHKVHLVCNNGHTTSTKLFVHKILGNTNCHKTEKIANKACR